MKIDHLETRAATTRREKEREKGEGRRGKGNTDMKQKPEVRRQYIYTYSRFKKKTDRKNIINDINRCKCFTSRFFKHEKAERNAPVTNNQTNKQTRTYKHTHSTSYEKKKNFDIMINNNILRTQKSAFEYFPF